MLSIDWTLYLYTLKYIHSDALYRLNSLPVYIKVHAQWCSLLTELSKVCVRLESARWHKIILCRYLVKNQTKSMFVEHLTANIHFLVNLKMITYMWT